MQQFINNWASGLIVAVIIATIIELILPENKNKKYVKMVSGIFILFTIISPIRCTAAPPSIMQKVCLNIPTRRLS